MAEHKKLSMLVKLDDGQTYTLGGDGADNAVTLDTEQTITGLKTFDKLPQSSVEPKADADLITKGYADGHYLPVDTKPHKYDILVKMKHDGTSLVGFSDFSVRLRDGTRLDIKHIENQSATTATKPVKAVFKTVKDLKAPIEAPKQQAATFFDTYDLEAGEFTGTVSFYKAVGKFGPASRDINPWYVYVGSGNANNYDGIYAVSIDNLDKPLLGVNFKFGDAHNSETYTCLQCGVVFTVDGSALEVAYDGDMSNAFETTIEYPINAQSMIGVVKVDNAQEITGAKTFTQNIKVTAKPKESTDVATVGYVSGLLNAKAPYEVTLDFKVEDDTDGGWVVYSNMEINLDNGKKLKCIHLDNTQPTSANAPVKAVFKAIPATEVINAAPTAQAPTFFDTYQLQDEEYLGTLTYGHILNSQLQDYASYTGPFHSNQYGTTCTIEEATQLRITLSGLPAAVTKVSLQFSSSYLPKTFKASMSGVGIEVTSNVLTNPSGNTPLELLFDVVKLTGLVTLDTAQTITGVKIFEKLPKSSGKPKKGDDLVNKDYIDNILLSPQDYTISIFSVPRTSTGYMAISNMVFNLKNGNFLKPLYIENGVAGTVQSNRIIYDVVDKKEGEFRYPTKVDKSTFDNHLAAMQDTWIEGVVYYSQGLDSDLWDSQTYNPFYAFASSPGTPRPDSFYHILKFDFKKCPAPISSIDATVGSARHDNSFVPKAYKASITANGVTSEVPEMDVSSMTNNTPIVINFDDDLGLGKTIVHTNNVQEITALKTFNVLPQSEAVPADDKDLVNKKYVDEKVGAGGGTGGAAPANMVTTDTAQNITEVKTFDKLPKSSVEPTDDTELVNKKYVDSKAASAGGNVVTLDTEQTISGAKTFEKLPKSDAVPADANELVNKAYVDAAAKSLQGYEITLYGTPKTNGLIGFKNLRFYFANGLRLYPRLVDDTAANTANEAKRFIWTLVNTSSYEDVQAQAKPKAELDKYVLTSSEYDGLITYPQTCGKFTLTRDNWFAIGGYVRVQGQATNGEQPIVKLRVLGSLAPITKMELTIDSDTNYIAESLRAEVSKIGDTPKASNTVNPTAVNELVTFNIEETFKPDAYYVNRFDDQDVFGRKAFKSVPTVYKDSKLYGVGAANTPALFGDLAPGLALPAPEVQAINIGVTSKETKRKQGMDWVYDFNLSVTLGAMQVKIRRASDLAEEQLYLKAVGPSSKGYRGILTNQQPSGYPNHVVEQMSQENMNAYKLQAGEYFAKLAFASSGRGSVSEENWKRAVEQGSDKITALFAASTSSFYTGSTSGNKFPTSSNSPQANIMLYIYDCPIVSSWTLQNMSENRAEDYFYIETASKSMSYRQSQFKDAQFAKDIPDVRLQTINLLGAIEALQKTNTALEARIKALEDAAPKPQYKLIVVIL